MGWVLNDISPSNNFEKILWSQRYFQNSQTVLADTGMNGTTLPMLRLLSS